MGAYNAWVKFCHDKKDRDKKSGHPEAATPGSTVESKVTPLFQTPFGPPAPNPTINQPKVEAYTIVKLRPRALQQCKPQPWADSWLGLAVEKASAECTFWLRILYYVYE